MGLLGLLGFLVLAALVLAHPEPLPMDRALHRFLLEHRTPIGDIAKVVTALGTAPVVLPVLLVASALWARARGRWWLVVVAPLLLLAGMAVRYSSMWLIDRPRPPVEDWLVLASGQSFPSGHTTTAALAYGLSVVLLAGSLRRGAVRTVLMALLLAVAGLAGVSRVVLGVHWPTDVLGGWCLALFLVSVSTVLLARLGRARDDTSGRNPAGLRV